MMSREMLVRLGRRAVVLAATVAVIGVGVGVVQVAAQWRAEAAPLDTAPVGMTRDQRRLRHRGRARRGPRRPDGRRRGADLGPPGGPDHRQREHRRRHAGGHRAPGAARRREGEAHRSSRSSSRPRRRASSSSTGPRPARPLSTGPRRRAAAEAAADPDPRRLRSTRRRRTMTERALPAIGVGVRPRPGITAAPRPVSRTHVRDATRPAVARKEAILTTPARAGMLVGASAAVYALTLAGISGLQAEADAAVAAARAPYQDVLAQTRAANDELEARVLQGRRRDPRPGRHVRQGRHERRGLPGPPRLARRAGRGGPGQRGGPPDAHQAADRHDARRRRRELALRRRLDAPGPRPPRPAPPGADAVLAVPSVSTSLLRGRRTSGARHLRGARPRIRAAPERPPPRAASPAPTRRRPGRGRRRMGRGPGGVRRRGRWRSPGSATTPS